MRRADGAYVWLMDEATAVPGPDGHPLFLQGLMFDITERQQSEERLRALGRLKDTVLHTLSHDLRSPLTAIVVAASTLERLGDDLDDETRAHLLRTLVQRSKGMNAILTDLLDLDRLAGELAARSSVHRVTSVYFDTADFALGRHGTAARLRHFDDVVTQRVEVETSDRSGVNTRTHWESVARADRPDLSGLKDALPPEAGLSAAEVKVVLDIGANVGVYTLYAAMILSCTLMIFGVWTRVTTIVTWLPAATDRSVANVVTSRCGVETSRIVVSSVAQRFFASPIAHSM